MTAVKYVVGFDGKALSLRDPKVLKQLFAGCPMSLSRDMVSGAVYGQCRSFLGFSEGLPIDQQALINGTSGFVASVATAPANFIRNMQLHYDGASAVLTGRMLWAEAGQVEESSLRKLAYLGGRAKIFPGAARVGAQYAAGEFLYSYFKNVEACVIS